MSNVKAIFKKQFKGTVQNPEILLQFILYPLLAFLLNIMFVQDFYGIPEDIAELLIANTPNMVTMQATIFAGMGLITVIAGIIAEDIEKKSLRFLTMAGVKPLSYLVGVSGVILLASLVTSMAFAWIAEFNGQNFWIFTAAMMSSVVGSTVLGAVIGMLAKNQQSASAIAMPIAVVLGFGPMMAQFNARMADVMHVFYTQQLNVVADYLTRGTGNTPLWQSFAIMWGNVAALGILFVIVYRRKGLKG